MANCGCKGSPCNCSLELAPDASILFRGTGILTDPYILSALNPGYIRPAGRSSSSVAQSNNTANVDTAATMNTEEFDTDNMVDIAGFPTRITINTAGYYLIGGQIKFSTSTATVPLYCKIRRNGTIIESVDSMSDRSGFSGIYVTSQCMVSCAVTDYFEVILNQNAVNYQVSEMHLWALRLGART